MKYAFLLAALIFTCTFTIAATQALPDDPWEDYSKKHNHPVVPEPSTYGLIFVATTISFVLIHRKMKK